MEPKKRRKTKGTVIIGRGAATVRIYPISRKNGYPQNTVCWKEGGRRRTRCFACMDEAKMVAQQISVRLTNGWSLGDEVTRRDIEILRPLRAGVQLLSGGHLLLHGGAHPLPQPLTRLALYCQLGFSTRNQ